MSQRQSHLKREEVIEGLTDMVTGYLLQTGGVAPAPAKASPRRRRQLPAPAARS